MKAIVTKSCVPAAKSRHWDAGIRRHRTLARSLHGRLYVSGDRRLWLVRGRPDSNELHQLLTTANKGPITASEPLLERLGLACATDGEVTVSLLSSMQQSLQFWEAALRRAQAVGPRDRRTVARLQQEMDELRRLRSRVIFAYRLIRELRSGSDPIETPLVLTPAEQQTLNGQLAAVGLDFPLPRYEAWLARLVMWLSGEHAVKRFLAAAVSLIDAPLILAKTAALERLRDYLCVLKRRSEVENIGWLHWELAQRIDTLPRGLISKPGKRIKRSGKFVELCDRLVARCDQLLAGELQTARSYVPAAIAVVAASDNANGPVPAHLFKQCAERDLNVVQRQTRTLLGLCTDPGYERLLTFLAGGSDAVLDDELPIVQELLARGISETDVRWLGQFAVRLRYFHDAPTLSVTWVRRAHAILTQRKMHVEVSLLTLMSRADDRNHRAIVQQWLDWLARLTPATATPRLGTVLHSAIGDLLLPALELGLHGELQAWAAVAAGRGTWLQRIELMQRWSGVEVAAPQSVQKLLDYGVKSRAELAYLEELSSRDMATSGQVARRDYLRSALPRVGVNQQRVERQAEEAFVLIALDGLRAMIRRRAQEIWDQHSAWQTTDVPLGRLLAFARWLKKMPAESRELHGELMSAWRMHGEAYKLELRGNQAWLERARAQGMRCESWLSSGKFPAVVENRPVELCFSEDPREIFLMGTYFHTCLSLGDINQMSVLANAYDANKQVVFAYGEHAGKRVVLARMLVALTSDFKMLRFDIYSVVRPGEDVFDEKLRAAVLNYAAGRARAAGLSLTNSGNAEELGDHFWYNDGESQWPDEAKAAWQGAAEPQPVRALIVRPADLQFTISTMDLVAS